MALDYLSIPGKLVAPFVYSSITVLNTLAATSVDVERTFSRGRRLLSHVRSRLSAQTTHAVLCLGDWVRLDLVKAEDIRAISKLAEVKSDLLDYEMEAGWDRISGVLAASKGR